MLTSLVCHQQDLTSPEQENLLNQGRSPSPTSAAGRLPQQATLPYSPPLNLAVLLAQLLLAPWVVQAPAVGLCSCAAGSSPGAEALTPCNPSPTQPE